MPFTTQIHIAIPVREDERPARWETLEPLNFWSEKFHKNYVVPKGFYTDLASVPRTPLLWLLAGGRANAAAVVHDWLYRNGCQFKQIGSRQEADDVFFEAMVDTKVPLWRAWAMFTAVKCFGGRFYNGQE